MLAADGSLITNFFTNNRTPVAPDQIAAVMKQALVDIEDSRFYEHNGLDVQGTLRALVKNVAAGSVQEGGSTLTQQLVKQTLLQTATTPRGAAGGRRSRRVGRKLKEARLALALEQTYSKDEILTRYLNIVYFGEGAYGIEAAAQKYFSVARRRPHAPPGGDARRPGAEPDRTTTRSPSPRTPRTGATRCCERMHTLGHISDQELADHRGRSRSRSSEGADPPNGCIDAAVGGFFCDYLYSYLTGTLGLTQNEHQERRLDDPDDAAARPAALRPTRRVLDHVADGRPARRRPRRRAAGHRARAGDERQPPLRLQRPRLRVGQPQRRAAAGRRVDVQGLHRGGRPVGGLRVELHAARARSPTPPTCTRRTAARGAPRTSSATTTPATPRRTT